MNLLTSFSEVDSKKFLGITFVGVGPGDPSLITLAAINSIEAATLVAYPVSKIGGEGMALKIASKWLKREQIRMPLVFPMVNDEQLLRASWTEAAGTLAKAVNNGEQVVFLCQGDVSLFASSSYVLLRLKSCYPNCAVRLVPGVTSISAAAAVGSWPLALQKDQLLVLPAPEEPLELEKLLEEAALQGRVLVLLKLGSRWSWVRKVLKKRKLLRNSLFAQKVGFIDENVTSAEKVPASEKPYFSLLMIRQCWPKIMP